MTKKDIISEKRKYDRLDDKAFKITLVFGFAALRESFDFYGDFI